MKLASAAAYCVKVPPPHFGGRFWFFVRLETEDGVVGWGEVAILGGLYGLQPAFRPLVENSFDRFLKGRNPLDRDMLTKSMYVWFSARHPDYFLGGLISAFDVAMWDICGKHFGAPVCDLLGGRHRTRIRSYTYLYDLDAPVFEATAEMWVGNPDRCAEMAARLVEEGFTAVKLDPLRYFEHPKLPPWECTPAALDHAVRTIEAIRNAVGTRADILVGTHGQMTPSVSRRLAKALERSAPLWLEEPCPPENVDEMARIAASTCVPIATGERLAWVHDFQKLFAAGACHFAQPDLGSCGGITAAKQIAALAEAHHVLMAPHVWGGPIITAAAMQIDACIQNFLIQESIYKSRGFFDEIVREPFEWSDGDLVLQDRPGIGIELVEKSLEKYAA